MKKKLEELIKEFQKERAKAFKKYLQGRDDGEWRYWNGAVSALETFRDILEYED